MQLIFIHSSKIRPIPTFSEMITLIVMALKKKILMIETPKAFCK